MPGKLLPTQFLFNGAIPADIAQSGIRGHQTLYQDPLVVLDRETNSELDNNGLLKNLLKNSDIDISLRTIGNAFFPRVVSILTTPTLIVAPNRVPRGYTFLNANQTVSGVVTVVTVSAIGTVFAVGVTNTASIAVSGYSNATFMLDITDACAALTVDLQSQDPLSGNWVTIQSDIFGGSASVGTYHAFVGPLGIDSFARLVVTVGGDTMTGSISAQLKPSLAGTIAGPSIFLGGADVNTTIGLPLLAGTRDTFFLRENTALYGVAVATTSLNLFELQ